MTPDVSRELAGIQYMGEAGSSANCKNAVIGLIQFSDRSKHARIMSHDGEHGLLLTTDIGDLIAIRSGFASGYGGAGPAALSYVLALLNAYGIETDAVDVAKEVLVRLDMSA